MNKATSLMTEAKKCVFVGYDSRTKGYKLYNPKDGKVIISRDVDFDEEAMWDWQVQDESYDFSGIHGGRRRRQ